METTKSKVVLIAGGSGLIGTKLSRLLLDKKYTVCFLTRKKDVNNVNTFSWDPQKKIIDERAIAMADVIINLAGESIAEKRWTHGRKRKIINSRIFATTLLYESLVKIPNKVQTVINASAIGIYGNTGPMIMHEDSPSANDFLGLTCQRWEACSHEFEKLNLRSVIIRIGLVLSQEQGFLPEIMSPLKLGIAPYFGNGKQYISWIHIDDLCKLIEYGIRNENVRGTYNAVSPGPLSNKNFMKLISHIKGGKFFFIRIPAIILKLFIGELSTLILSGSRASSKKIESTGFAFKYPVASSAIRNLTDN